MALEICLAFLSFLFDDCKYITIENVKRNVLRRYILNMKRFLQMNNYKYMARLQEL
jgi:hypothetical protein